MHRIGIVNGVGKITAYTCLDEDTVNTYCFAEADFKWFTEYARPRLPKMDTKPPCVKYSLAGIHNDVISNEVYPGVEMTDEGWLEFKGYKINPALFKGDKKWDDNFGSTV